MVAQVPKSVLDQHRSENPKMLLTAASAPLQLAIGNHQSAIVTRPSRLTCLMFGLRNVLSKFNLTK
jgi:hypothetical protein